MGIIKNPLKIHWTGGVDGMVGFYRKGAAVFRSYAQNVSNPRTDAQTLTRQKFSVLSRLMASLNPSYAVGLSSFEGNGKTARDVASKLNWPAISGRINEVVVDFSQVIISKGSTLLPYSMIAAPNQTNHLFNFTWSDNTGAHGARSDDSLNVLVLNTTQGVSVFGENIATRNAESATIAYPTQWTGDTLYVYAFMRSVDGSASDTKASGPFEA